MPKQKKAKQKLINISKAEHLPKALKDVLGRTPKSMSIEFELPADAKVADDDGGWSGNVYKYNY
jgi:hypothetical protein